MTARSGRAKEGLSCGARDSRDRLPGLATSFLRRPVLLVASSEFRKPRGDSPVDGIRRMRAAVGGGAGRGAGQDSGKPARVYRNATRGCALRWRHCVDAGQGIANKVQHLSLHSALPGDDFLELTCRSRSIHTFGDPQQAQDLPL